MNELEEWAKIQFALSESRERTLESLGHTEKSLRELEAKALALITSDITPTTYGNVQRIPDKPIQWRRSTKDEQVMTKKKLKLLKKESLTKQ